MTISRDVACFLPLLQSGPRLPINTQGSAKPPPWAKFCNRFAVKNSYTARRVSHFSPVTLQETPTCPTKLPEFRTTERSWRTPTSPRAPGTEHAERQRPNAFLSPPTSGTLFDVLLTSHRSSLSALPALSAFSNFAPSFETPAASSDRSAFPGIPITLRNLGTWPVENL